MFSMIGEGIGLLRDWFASKRANVNAALPLQNAQLSSFKGSNLLREISFLFVALPVTLAAVFPNFIHQCVQNVFYAIPTHMLWLLGGMILSEFGLGSFKRFFRG